MARPFIKWAGGKNQLLNEIEIRLPKEFNRYIEPFVGGGALFCHLNSENSVINDMNYQLINAYKQIRDDHESLISLLDCMENEFNSLNSQEEKQEYFYKTRNDFNSNMFNETQTAIDAARFIFLNKTCFNGLYRCNANGLFNAPFGKKEKVKTYELDNIKELSFKLKNTKIMNGDFEEACKYLRKGDFVFFDSPYFDTFDTYQKGGFSKESHIRLAKLFEKLTSKGVYCMLTNSNTDFVKDLYKEYNIDVVEVKRMINCDGKNRTGTEVIITNY